MNARIKILLSALAVMTATIAVVVVSQRGFAWTNPTGNPPLATSGIITSGGNIGIGTTVPASVLDVKDPNVWRALTVRGSGGTDAVVAGNYNGTAAIGAHNGALNAWANLAINFGGGNVGIGTVSPAYKLDVSGDINFTGTLRQNGTAFSSGLGGSGTANYLSKWTTGTALGNSQIFDDGTSVGIGTASPTAPLYVAGADAGTQQLRLGHSNGANYWGLGRDNLATGDLIITNGASEKMRIQNGGNVGIGTASPAYKLDVVGDIRAQNAWLRTTGNTGWYSDTWGGGWYMQDGGWVRVYNNKGLWMGVGLVGSDGGLTIGYGGSGSPVGGAIISGNVGIGTATPNAKLSVAGAVISTRGTILNGMVYCNGGITFGASYFTCTTPYVRFLLGASGIQNVPLSDYAGGTQLTIACYALNGSGYNSRVTGAGNPLAAYIYLSGGDTVSSLWYYMYSSPVSSLNCNY